MLQQFINSIIHIRDVKDARKLPLGTVIGYLFLMALLMSLPVAYEVAQVMAGIQADGQEIAAKLPDFTIENGQLTTPEEKEGFIYQTDAIVLTFDPAGKRNSTDVAADMVGNYFSIGLLKNELVVALPASASGSSLLGSNLIELPYTEAMVKDLSGANIKDYMAHKSMPWWIFPIIILVSIYPSFLNLLLALLMATLIANITTRWKRQPLRFMENFKIMAFTITVPALISIPLQIIWPHLDPTYFLMAAGLFLFFQATKDIPGITPPSA